MSEIDAALKLWNTWNELGALDKIDELKKDNRLNGLSDPTFMKVLAGDYGLDADGEYGNTKAASDFRNRLDVDRFRALGEIYDTPPQPQQPTGEPTSMSNTEGWSTQDQIDTHNTYRNMYPDKYGMMQDAGFGENPYLKGRMESLKRAESQKELQGLSDYYAGAPSGGNLSQLLGSTSLIENNPDASKNFLQAAGKSGEWEHDRAMENLDAGNQMALERLKAKNAQDRKVFDEETAQAKKDFERKDDRDKLRNRLGPYLKMVQNVKTKGKIYGLGANIASEVKSWFNVSDARQKLASENKTLYTFLARNISQEVGNLAQAEQLNTRGYTITGYETTGIRNLKEKYLRLIIEDKYDFDTLMYEYTKALASAFKNKSDVEKVASGVYIPKENTPREKALQIVNDFNSGAEGIDPAMLEIAKKILSESE